MKSTSNRIKINRLFYHHFICDTGGVGYIRGFFPSIVVSSQRHNNTEFFGSVGCNFIDDIRFYADKFFIKFQRSATKDQLMFLRALKEKRNQLKMKFKILYDIDDHLFEIPKWNQAYQYYEANKEFCEQIIREVDGVVTSMPFLKNEMEYYNPNVSIVKNYMLKSMWGNFTERKEENKKPRILYPCSGNHFAHQHTYEKNGGDIKETLLNFISKTTDKYDWVFVGAFPLELKDKIQNKEIEFHKWQDIFSYPMFLNNLKCDIGIAPLEVNKFNRSKSDIKLLEYSALKIPGIYTNIEPYFRAKMKSNSEEEMISMIEELASNPDKRNEIWKKDNEILEKRWMEENVKEWINSHLKCFGKKIM